jgi:hypothetical protein
MYKLPFDYARCAEVPENAGCPFADQCLRRISPGRPNYQSFSAFEGGSDCSGLILKESLHHP